MRRNRQTLKFHDPRTMLHWKEVFQPHPSLIIRAEGWEGSAYVVTWEWRA